MIASPAPGSLAAASDVDRWLEGLRLAFDEVEPLVGAFVEEPDRWSRLAAAARSLLLRYPDERDRPPFFGVAVGVKDIFHVDGLETRAGSSVPPAELAGPQAESVRRLAAAGAIVLGKTVTTEFAYFAPRGTRNPADPDRTPGGSSSGSAAAVAAGLCPLSLGTQTIGSISRPASYCGVVGFKPSYERIPRTGVIPLAPSVDHVGFFTPDVAAARRAAAVLLDGWLGGGDGRPPRLAIPTGPYLDALEPGGRERFERGCRLLADAGLEWQDVPAMPDFDDVVARHRRLVAAEAAEVHREWFARYGESYHPKTRELIESGLEVDAEELEAARRGRLRLRQELESEMERHGIDVWLTPASQDVAPTGLDSTGDPILNLPWSHAGLPSITLPSITPAASAKGELPFGLQFVGRFGADEALLEAAAAWERGLGR